MQFEEVSDDLRTYNKGRSNKWLPLVEALKQGKTVRISGFTSTEIHGSLRYHFFGSGLKVRCQRQPDDSVVVWAEDR